MSDPELTKNQQLFVKEYLVDLNGTQAAIRAGYAEVGAHVEASRLLRNAKVSSAIAKEFAARAKRVEVKADYVFSTIIDTIERCKQEEPVRDKDGNETGEYVFNAQAVLKGAELLGKHLKLFTDKVEVSTDDDLAERLAAARERSKQG